MLSDSFETGLKKLCLHISDSFRLDGASTEEEDADAVAAADEEEEIQWTDLERQMEAAAADLERQMEAVAEADKIAKRGMKEAAEESMVKAAATKATDSVSSARNLSATTSASTTAFTFTRAPNPTSSVVGVARRSGYSLIRIMLDTIIIYIRVSSER